MRMLLMLHPRAGAHRQRAAILSQHACLVPDSRDFFRRVDSGGRHPKCPPHVFSDADVVAFRRSVVASWVPQVAQKSFLRVVDTKIGRSCTRCELGRERRSFRALRVSRVDFELESFLRFRAIRQCVRSWEKKEEREKNQWWSRATRTLSFIPRYLC